MNWSGKRVLVTGGGGFIGSNVVEALVRRGAEVKAFVRYNGGARIGALEFLPQDVAAQVQIVSGDLADPATATSLVEGEDIVVHLAALVGIPYSYIHPIEVIRTNTMGTAYLLEACRLKGIERIVCFSTSEVYGSALYAPIDEEHPLQAQSPYAASKIGADQIALSYFRSFNVPVAIIRPFNTFGPRQSSRAVIPTIITQALRGGAVRLGSTFPTRDLCYVGDTAEAVVRIAEVAEAVGQVINVGTGREISVGDLAEMIFAYLGVRPELIVDEQRVRPEHSEVKRLIASFAKAEKLLDWRPTVSLEEGLGQTIDWIKDNPGFFRSDVYHV